MPRGRSFEDFYYRHVAIAEACGCAEMQIGRLDLDRARAAAGAGPEGRPRLGATAPVRRRLARWWIRLAGRPLA